MKMMKMISLLSIYAVVSSYLLYLINAIMPEAYMDEIFHYPQTKSYCNHQYHEWDNKITTLPGTYIFGVIYVRLMRLECTVMNLRHISWVFGNGSNVLIMLLLQQTQQDNDSLATLLQAFSIMCLPLHLFFFFMYYTETISTFWVLASFYLLRRARLSNKRLRYGGMVWEHLLSALFSAISILIRQTNVIWVAFVMGTEMLEELQATAKLQHDQNPLLEILNFAKLLIKHRTRLFSLFRPQLIIIALFIGFVFVNGGIVVGDRENHRPSFHFPQLAYYSVFAAAGYSVKMISWGQLQAFSSWLRRSLSSVYSAVLLAGGICTGLILLHQFTIIHPFLLADNRHYTSSFARHVLVEHDWMRLALAPIYLYCVWTLYSELRRKQTFLWTLIYLVAVTLVLIPSPLIEFRYYILPFVIYHVNTAHQGVAQSLITASIYISINILTIYRFLYRPYTWNDGTSARFMW